MASPDSTDRFDTDRICNFLYQFHAAGNTQLTGCDFMPYAASSSPAFSASRKFPHALESRRIPAYNTNQVTDPLTLFVKQACLSGSTEGNVIYNIDFDIRALFISGFSVFFVLYVQSGNVPE